MKVEAASAKADVEPHRRYLTGIAYRMLGSYAEAEDVVQEVYLRWHRTDQSKVVDCRSFLARIAARLCLDVLKSARICGLALHATLPQRIES